MIKYLHYPIFFVIVLVLFMGSSGCFKEIVEVRESLPNIIWPKPPADPRIRFINSVSKAADLNIEQEKFSKFLRFLKGEKEKFIVHPYGLATDSEGRLYVVDTLKRHIHVFDDKRNEYYIFPERGTSLISPIDVAVSQKGYVFVTDSTDAVVKIFKDHGREYIKKIGAGLFERPTGIAVNNQTGELLVVDTKNSQIMRFDVESYRFKGAIGGEGNAQGSFYNPTNIFVSGNGTIYVSDALNFRIQIFTPEGEFIRDFGDVGDGPGYLARPRGVAVDSEGNIYVVDALFDNVQIFNRSGQLLMAFGSPGNEYGEFWLPSGIYIDNNDRVYVADSYNNRVQIFQYIKTADLINP